jgi:peptide deformylase
MAQHLRITVVGEDVLHRPCEPVTAAEFGTAELAALVEDMFRTMDVAEGAGLAANQVGVDLRLFVYDCRDESGRRHVGHVCNPVLEVPEPRRLVEDREGCLSVPGPSMRLARPDHAVVRGQDVHGGPVTVEGRGYFARCLQHETDHLDGHLYLDRLPERTRRKALREMADKRDAVFARRAARAAARW